MEAAGKKYIIFGQNPRTARFKIWNLSDLHLMSRSCAEGKLQKDIDEIRDDPYSFWLGGGDYCDFITTDDKRFDPDAVAPWVSVQDLANIGEVGYRKVRDLFEPIAHKCIGLLFGNHELSHARHKDQADRHGWLCMELGVRNLGYCMLGDVVFVYDPRHKEPPQLSDKRPKGGRQTGRSDSFRLFAHHGAGFATTPGGKLNRLIQFMQSFEADVYFCGHVHDKVARCEPIITADASCKHIVARERHGVISGSYLRTYTQSDDGSVQMPSYGEQRAYRPVSLGAARVEIQPFTGQIEARV